MTTAQSTNEPKKKTKRENIGPRYGINLQVPVSLCVNAVSHENGVMPTTFIRMLISEGLTKRGWSRSRIDEVYGQATHESLS